MLGHRLPPTFPAIKTAPPLDLVGALVVSHPPIGETTFRGRGVDLPHIPDLSQPVLESSVRHLCSSVFSCENSSCEMLPARIIGPAAMTSLLSD
jgi:hypothetical protein